jgi:hypothetical protein
MTLPHPSTAQLVADATRSEQLRRVAESCRHSGQPADQRWFPNAVLVEVGRRLQAVVSALVSATRPEPRRARRTS